MTFELNRITIVKLRKPTDKDVNKDLQWLSESFGLFGERDKEKSTFRVFLELIKATRKRTALSSDDIALKSHLTRATVIHHLHKLQESGLVMNHENVYILRVDNLESLVSEVRKDVLRAFQDLQDVAKELDEELGLIKRKKSSTISD